MERVLALLQEFRDELGEVPEREEAAVEGPGGTSKWLLAVCVHVVLAATQDDAVVDRLLSRVWLGVEVLDGGLRNPVQEAEADGSSGVTNGSNQNGREAYCS